MFEHEGFGDFVVERYKKFDEGCEDISTQQCLDRYESYLKEKISLPAETVKRSIDSLKRSDLFRQREEL